MIRQLMDLNLRDLRALRGSFSITLPNTKKEPMEATTHGFLTQSVKAA
jgi:hypothetical protein